MGPRTTKRMNRSTTKRSSSGNGQLSKIHVSVELGFEHAGTKNLASFCLFISSHHQVHH